MFRKTIFSALLAAAAAAAVVILKEYKENKEEEKDDDEEEDDGIHFIEINNDDKEDEEEKPHEVHVEEVKIDDENDDEDDDVQIQEFPHEEPAAEEHEIPIETEDEPEAEEGGLDDAVKEVAELYPYLEPEFIKKVLDQDDDLKNQFAEDSLVTVRHTAVFEDEENRLKFAKVMEDNGYQTEMGQEHGITVSRRFFVEDGSILSDVLNTANQAAALGGKYSGFTVDPYDGQTL